MSTATLPAPAEQALFSSGEEYRVFGPPGTGKTTYLKRQVLRAAERYGESAVLVTSFSRTAARELVSRDLAIPPEQVGTLHAHCFRALNRPRLAESHLEDWNGRHPEYALKRSSKKESDLDRGLDESGGDSAGDELMAQFQQQADPKAATTATKGQKAAPKDDAEAALDRALGLAS